MIATQDTQQLATPTPAARPHRQAAPRHKAHTVQPTPTPAVIYQYQAGALYVIGGLLFAGLAVGVCAFWILVIRFLWRRGSRPAVEKGR